jgi:hypothetical protein
MKGLPMTDIVIALIDETGSMLSRLNETLVGYNTFLDGLRENVNVTYIKTYRFDKYMNEPPIRPLTDEALLVGDAPRLSRQNYSPRGNTPLYDAIGLAIGAGERLAKAKGASNVTVMIQTDGLENASTEFNYDRIKRLIADKQKANWNFLFLAADLGISGYTMSQGLGIGAAQTMSYNSTSSSEAFGAAARSVRGYGATGQSTGFSDEEKRKSGDTSV